MKKILFVLCFMMSFTLSYNALADLPTNFNCDAAADNLTTPNAPDDGVGIYYFIKGATNQAAAICKCVYTNSLNGCINYCNAHRTMCFNQDPTTYCTSASLGVYSHISKATNAAGMNNFGVLCGNGADRQGCIRSLVFFTSVTTTGYTDSDIQANDPAGSTLSNHSCPNQ